MEKDIALQENMSEEDVYDVSDSFPMLMGACVKHMRESLNARFASMGCTLSTEQWIILTHLAEQDGVSQLDIAKKYGSTEVSVVNLLKKLEAAELIVRRKDPVDGRRNRVFLTASGRKQQRALVPIAKANIVNLSRGLTDEEIEQLKNTLRTISGNVKG